MKKLLLILLSIGFLNACNSVKQTKKALHIGNYDQAINIALTKLRTNKEKKGKQPYVDMLVQAYGKAVDRDVNAISFLKKENQNTNLKQIYDTYNGLKNRQERIKPLLPLYHAAQNRNAVFIMDNYDDEIIATKEQLSASLYANAAHQLKNAKAKNEFRQVYKDLAYLEKISPNYKNSNQLKEEAHLKGTDFVKVTMKNEANVIIPKRLESDLLDFSTYGLNDLWTVYHSTAVNKVTYDYLMEVVLTRINISPEQIKERQLQREKLVKEGWEYLLDEDGKQVLDENGEKIKVDKMVKANCEYYEFTQFKTASVVGKVYYKNLSNKQLLDSYPLSSEYVFEHIYANHNGDKRALDNDLIRFLGLQAVQFPSNEQMVYDSGEDLKNKIKGIITRYRF